MARKTFVKVRRGILSPSHINAIGEAVWLYLYMLDRADWETGKIYDWRDQDAADDLGIYLGTIRNQRKKLTGIYIDCIQHPRGLEITVRKWADPRNKADIFNEEGDNESDNQSDNPLSVEGDNQSDTVTDTVTNNKGDSALSPLHRIKNKELRVKKQEGIPAPPVFRNDYQFSQGWEVRVFSDVTGIGGIPGSDMPKVMAAFDALRAKYTTERELIAYLKPYFENWITRKTKDGRKYSRSNCAWLYDMALAGDPIKESRGIPVKIFHAPQPDPDCPYCHGTGKRMGNSGRYVVCECVKEVADARVD